MKTPMKTPGVDLNLGITVRFAVVVDGTDLGLWKSCKGLSVTYKSTAMYEGGCYDTPVAYLADHLEYGTLSLQRAMSATDSPKVQAWLRRLEQHWFSNENCDYRGGTAAITLCNSAMEPVISWSLRNVYPSRWVGPDLDSMGTGGIALETLELVYQGFL